MDNDRDMQVKIVAAMRLYGMTPVLPGFAGHVCVAAWLNACLL
jgi:hypothetical protein